MIRAGVALAGVVLALAPVSPVHAGEPYGGCDEAWQAPESPGADDCRALGWTVRARLLVDPSRTVVADALPACHVENMTRSASVCGYNLRRVGPGRRAWYAIGHGRRWTMHYVHPMRVC